MYALEYQRRPNILNKLTYQVVCVDEEHLINFNVGTCLKMMLIY